MNRWSSPSLALLGVAVPLSGAGEDFAFFESNIRPVLVEHCYDCHSVESGKSKGGLLLDSRAAARRGGDTGPAVVPGEPAASLLLDAISHSDPDLEMPPKKARLPDGVIANFRKWIEQGAPDPREAVAGDSPAEKPPVDIESGRRFWAFVKPARREFPVVSGKSWPKRPLDRFVLARLEEEGLEPSPDAEPAVLLRRLHFDLAGLPPDPGRVRSFLEAIGKGEEIDPVLAREADWLLASERFGERWGRHWLDVARFAESTGKETNVTYPQAWRYRNYVIDSFNAGKPFDQFLSEQIAGDLMEAESDERRHELLVATGFLAVGPRSVNEMNRFQFLADLADEQIDTVTRAFMGMSVACARCHDHKFDPFSMTDYYALGGIFVSTRTYFGTPIGPGNVIGGELIHLPKIESDILPNPDFKPMKMALLRKRLADLDAEEKERKARAKAAVERGEDPDPHYSLEDAIRIMWQRGGVKGQLATVDESGKALALAMGVMDRDTIHDAPLLDRGEIGRPGEKIPRGFPAVIQYSDPVEVAEDRSGRLELARWLTHPEHPLTARVMANRVWNHLFGAGLVKTTDNFGFNGERPSHPELLDHLALRFGETWSVKELIREIVLSRTYRQASAYRDGAFQKDPENRLLWRMPKRRLEAEAMRDAMLAVSGDLVLERPEASLVASIGDKDVGIFGFIKQVPPDLDGSVHRSVYLPVIRDRLPDVLDLFDFAEPSLVTGARDVTNVPVQALYFMNSQFVRDRAASLAKRAGSRESAFELCFSRRPDAEERKLIEEFEGALESFCQALLSTSEFRFRD